MRVKVFGMENCAGCDTVKAVLTSKGVEFEYRDVMNVKHMEEAQLAGVRAVPTTFVVVDGVEHVFTGSTKAVIDSIKLHVGV
jgi:glutaredoxin